LIILKNFGKQKKRILAYVRQSSRNLVQYFSAKSNQTGEFQVYWGFGSQGFGFHWILQPYDG